jgi:hypothetical protein
LPPIYKNIAYFTQYSVIIQIIYSMLDLTINHHSKFSKYSLSTCSTATKSNAVFFAITQNTSNALHTSMLYCKQIACAAAAALSVFRGG